MFRGHEFVVEVIHVPAWSAGEVYEGVLRISSRAGEDMLSFDGRKVLVMTIGTTDEAELT